MLLTAAALSTCSPSAPPGIVESAEPEFLGSVNADYLMSQMRQLGPRFEGCYARALAGNRTAEGTIGFELLGGEGRMIPSVVSNSTGDTVLTRCVIGAIAGLAIVEPDTGPRWRYTGKWAVDFRIARRRRSDD
jgi:hypothetical protein